MKTLLLTLLLPLAVQAEETLPFPTTTVTEQVVAQERMLDGIVEAVNKTTVSAQTSGQVEAVYYDVDDYVEKGQVIVKLKAKKQSASAKQARAQLAEAKARLKQASKEYARIKRVYERKLVAKSKLDAARAELDSARARLAAAKAQLAKAGEQLGDTQVRAPYSGIVTARHIQPGEFVNVGQKLMTGISLDKLRISVNVPQSLINKVRQYKKARLIDGKMGSVPVTNLTFFPYADPGSNTFKVRVNLAEKVKGLLPGMFVKVAFTTGKQKQLVVPEKAVAYRGEVSGVYVIDQHGMPHFRYVRLGRHAGEDKVVVLAGLEAGETIALDPIAAGIYRKRQGRQQEVESHE